LEFEVASVRLDNGEFKAPSFALSSDDWFREPNGRFHADFTVTTYIEFAYKIWPTREESSAMWDGRPYWVKHEHFDIEATASEHATKDQYRLMMQALLAERFGLKVHWEQKEMPVLEMTLIHPGKPGPRLIPHEKGLDCDAKPTDGSRLFPCYAYSARPQEDGEWVTGSRATSMELLAKFIGSTGGMTDETSRPVVDRTGLTGLWDFSIVTAPSAKPGETTPAVNGPTFLEAIGEQLGVKLKPSRAVLPVLVIDHLDRPSEN
jgi:uncharacterized protein (TIGR03435 family)